MAQVLIKVDEDLPAAVARELREAGYDAKTVAEQGWSGRKDPLIWKGIQKEGRLLVTADKGFADIRLLAQRRHSGVILLRLDRESWQGYVHLIQKLLSSTQLERLVDALTIVSLRSVRIRRSSASRE